MSAAAWTPEAAAILREQWIAGAGSGAIAKRLGVSRNAVLGRARRMGLVGLGLKPDAAPSRADDERALAALRLVDRGAGITTAAQTFGLDRDFLGAIVREARAA